MLEPMESKMVSLCRADKRNGGFCAKVVPCTQKGKVTQIGEPIDLEKSVCATGVFTDLFAASPQV